MQIAKPSIVILTAASGGFAATTMALVYVNGRKVVRLQRGRVMFDLPEEVLPRFDTAMRDFASKVSNSQSPHLVHAETCFSDAVAAEDIAVSKEVLGDDASAERRMLERKIAGIERDAVKIEKDAELAKKAAFLANQRAAQLKEAAATVRNLADKAVKELVGES